MKCRRNIVLLFAVINAALLSCVSNDIPDIHKEGEPTHINILTKGILNPTEPDERILTLRIMAFSPSGLIKSNVFYGPDELAETLTLEIKTGSYKFVFIANELSAGYLYESLGVVTKYSDLNTIQMPASAFTSDQDIPMIFVKDNVTVLPDEKIIIDGSTTKVWNIELERLAVRFDLILHAEEDLTAFFQGVRFYNLPDNVPLLPEYADYAGSRNTVREIPASSFEHIEDETYAWSVKAERIILPSNVFSTRSDATNAIMMSIMSNGDETIPGTTVGGNESQNDYTSPRNYHYTVNGIIRQGGIPDISIEASEWDHVDISGSPGNRLLNLSAVSAEVSALHSQRIYFWSNQQEVFVESVGYQGSGTGTPFVVNDIFEGLTGENAFNFNYDPQTGEGYLDLNTIYTQEEVSCRIILNAGGMRRELWGVVKKPGIIASDWETSPYVGTFHRWNQVGERIIFSGDIGEWNAEVISWTVNGTVINRGDGNDDTCWVVLSKKRSTDRMVGTETLRNAEDYPVEGNLTSVSGKGILYFRVGLKGILSSADSPPRYARIRVSYGTNGVSDIYVRQGEEADYIFDNTEYVETIQRTYAKKIAALNITVPANKRGEQKVDVGTNGSTWVDYPSQTGYQFPWYRTIAYMPGVALSPTSLFEMTITSSNNWSTAWESCPSNFRRFDSNVGSNNGRNVMQYSEVGQSLFLENPGADLSAGYKDNNKWGVYADGFFDRVKRDTDTFVKPGPEMACRGMLIYHPEKLRSVFIPGTGYRSSATNFGRPGINGIYWTKTPNSSLSSAQGFNVNNSSGIYINTTGVQNKYYATSIRCVRN